MKKIANALVCVSLLGAAAADILKDAGIKLGERLTAAAIARVTGAVAKRMATSAAARLLAKLGLSSATNFARLVPIAGGIVAAGVDAGATKAIGAHLGASGRVAGDTHGLHATRK